MNPYWDADFFQFFYIFFSRIKGLITGSYLFVSDEIQLGVLSFVALSCGVVGPFLVLKRMAMFANALSHTVLLGIVSAYLITSSLFAAGMFDLSTLVIGALIAALITALFTEGFVRLFRLPEEASIGLVFTTLFALGIVLVTLHTRNVHLGIETIMGNVDALHISDLSTSFCIVGFSVSLVILFYRQLQISSFDPHFGMTLGIRCALFHFLLLFLVALVCVSAFRSVGVILVLAFLVGPYLTIRLFVHRLSWILFLTPILGIVASLIGVALSRHFLSVYGVPLSTGGIVAVVIGLFYAIGVVSKGSKQ